MKKLLKISCFVAGIGVIIFFNVVKAQDSGSELKLYLGETKTVSVDNPVRIALGNPDIADVSSVSRESLTISPKSVGKTTLIFWDNFGEQSYLLNVYKEDVTGVKKSIDSTLKKIGIGRVYTKVNEEESKVLLMGSVSTPQEKERLLTALESTRSKISDLVQVKEEETIIGINVQVLELTKDATNTLGFSWPGGISNVTEVASPALTAVSASNKFSGLFHITDLKRDAFQWSLDALVEQGKAKILSRPQLACQTGKEAELLVGGEKPILTTQVNTGGSSTNVEYKEYGIKLKIKPSISQDNKSRINIKLTVEVSEPGTVEVLGSATAPTAKAYPMSKRNATTEVFLNDGQTIAIGGMVSSKNEESVRKTPFLGDVPVLGALFRKRTTMSGGGSGNKGNIELFITLTPTIIAEKNEPEQPLKDNDNNEGRFIPESGISQSPSEATRRYVETIQSTLLKNFAYPASFKDAGYNGTVKLALHISYSGELLDVSVRQSSGYSPLDEHALSMVRNIGKYPPFPSSIIVNDLWIDVPVVYQLD